MVGNLLPLLLVLILLLIELFSTLHSHDQKPDSCSAGTATSQQHPVVQQVPISRAADWIFHALLEEENGEVLDNVDGKAFGRPLVKERIHNWLGPMETPNGKYSSATSFSAYIPNNNQPTAHCGIKTGVVHQYKNGMEVGYLVTVYTATRFRKQGMARAVVQAATQHAFETLGVEEVAFLLADRNTVAQAFYKNIGFGPSDIMFQRGGIPMTLWTISAESFSPRTS